MTSKHRQSEVARLSISTQISAEESLETDSEVDFIPKQSQNPPNEPNADSEIDSEHRAANEPRSDSRIDSGTRGENLNRQQRPRRTPRPTFKVRENQITDESFKRA
jgi:hypothetical protein